MKLQILIDQYKHFLEILVSTTTMRNGLEELPDDLELTLSFENQPGGIIKDGKMTLNQPQIPRTVIQRKAELDRDIQILTARVKQIKIGIIKELQKEDE